MQSAQDVITFRSAAETDMPFLLDLRQQTMTAHLLVSGIDASPLAHLERIKLRFDCAQIIERNGSPIGLLKLVREGAMWELLQIQIDPALQSCGVGSRIIAAVMLDATEQNVGLRLSVLKANPARQLYQRLGFCICSENEHAYQMEFSVHGAQSSDIV